jgi:copper chaperone
METLKIKVGGMTCGGCVASVRRVVQALPGIERVDLSLEQGEATVRYDASVASRTQITKAIETAGFDAR